MLVSQMNHGDREIVRVLPAFRVRIFPEPLHATLDERAVRVLERPELFENVSEANPLLHVEEGVDAV
jgi:hypothetical protein